MREKRQSCAGAASYTHAHCQKMHFTKISSRLHNTIVFCFVVCPSQLCCKRPKCTVARKTVAMFIALGTHRLLVLACCVTASAHTVAVLLADKTIQQFGLARIVAAATGALSISPACFSICEFALAIVTVKTILAIICFVT